MSPESLEKKLQSLKPGERFQYEGIIYWKDKDTGELKSEPVILHDHNDDDLGYKPL